MKFSTTVGDIVITILILLFLFWLFLPITSKDDSDPSNGRSGLVVLTDQLTGCQYVGRGLTGLTPRMDGNNHQVGCH